MYVSYFKNTCSLYIVTSLKYTYYDITIEILKKTPKAYKDETQKICMQRSPAVSVAENGNYQANTD